MKCLQQILSKKYLTECYISLSSEIGKIGWLKRDNATILNVSKVMVEVLKDYSKHANIKDPLFI